MAADRYAREGLRVKLERIAGLTDKGILDEPYYFQNPPLNEWSIEHSHSHSVYETISAGQHSRRGGRELRRSSWTSLVVDTYLDDRNQPLPTFVILNEPKPIEELTAELVEICESGAPFLYTAAHQLPPGGVQDWSRTLAGPEAQWPAVLTRVRVGENAGEGDTRYFDLEFQEYRDPVVGRDKLGRAKGKGKGGVNFPAYAVLRPDGFAYDSKTGKRMGNGTPATLTQLARHYYRDPSMARIIARANGIAAGPNDRLVWQGADRGAFTIASGRTVKVTIPDPAVSGG